MTRTPEIPGIDPASGRQDASQRANAEDRLRHYEAIVHASGDAIVGGTLDGIIDVFNPAAERLFGYSAGDMIGQPVEHLLPTGEIEAIADGRRAVREGQLVSLETSARRPDGSLVDAAVTLSPLRDRGGQILGVTAIVRDVTERNRDASRLAEAHDRFAGAFSAAATGMALVAPDGRMLEVNDSLCRLLGRDAPTISSMTFQELTHPEDLDADLFELQRTVDGEIDSYQLTKRYLLPGGGIVWGLLTVSAVRDAGGRPLYFVSQIHDVTDRKTAEGELRRYAAQLEALAGQDPVTGLANRRTFEIAVAEELALFVADGTPVSLLVAVATTDGGALERAASALARGNRARDLVAHLGDGLLAVLLRDVDEAAARAVATRVAADLPPRVDVWATGARDGDDAPGLLRRAIAQAESAPAKARSPVLPSGVDRLLDLARRQLGMPVSFLDADRG
jgi:PAS domain S-box-containing protein